MGNNQTQEAQKENQKPKARLRDKFTICFSSIQINQDRNRAPKLNRTLSDNMKQSNTDILIRLNEEDMPHYSVKILQYLLTFLSVKEALNLRLVNRKLKFVVEVSSNIYANQLSNWFLRKLTLPIFVEYGSDKRFKQIFSEQLMKIELNQDESWIRIYRKLEKCIQSMNKFQKKMSTNFNIQFNLAQKILDSFKEPMIPISILTDDILKQSTTSWYQLAMTQQNQSKIENYNELDQIIDDLRIDCIGQFSTQNMQQAQLLIELRWLIVDNYISDPSTLEEQVPILLKFFLNILHMIYLRCLFSRNVLMIIKCNKQSTQLLNFYVILWKSFMGTIWGLNRLFEKLQMAIDKVFKFFYNTDAPNFTFISAMGRMWTQIVIKGAKRTHEIDPLELELLEAFQFLLKEKRLTLLDFFTKDQLLEEENNQQLKKFKDPYFQRNIMAIDCLLAHFASATLDLSLHEQSAHWIGHSKLQVGQFYAQLLENVVQDTNDIYSKASFLIQSNFDTFREYIQSDCKYLEEIINKWTVQICILPIGLDYLYDKIKINLRQYVINSHENIQILQQEIDEVNEEESLLESRILPQEEQLLVQEEETELQSRINRNDNPLEIMINQIINEEKLIKIENQLEIKRDSKQTEKRPSKVISIIQNEDNIKLRQLSKFSTTTRGSQITCLTSQFSQQLSSYRQGPEITFVREILSKLNNNTWVTRLQFIQKMDLENQIQIEKRNNQIDMRNYVKKINQNLKDNLDQLLDFTNVQILDNAMSLFEKKELTMEQFLEQTQIEPIYVNIQTTGQCLADSLVQQQ